MRPVLVMAAWSAICAAMGHYGQAAELGACKYVTSVQFEQCREKELKEYNDTHIRTHQFGGVLVRDLSGKYPEFAYFPRGGGVSHFGKAVYDRENRRCEAQAQILYLDDALDTRQELFDRCMDLQLRNP